MPTVEELHIPNFLANNIREELVLSADAASGQPTIAVQNTDGVANNDFLVFIPGSETSELLEILSISNLNITFTSNLILNHKNHERVIKLFGDQVKVYRAPNVDGTIPADTAFSALGSPVAIEPDTPSTLVTDSAGGSDYWYKFVYRNSITSAETDISYSEAIRGGGWGNYCSIESIRNEAGLDKVKQLQNSEIAERRAEAEDEINAALVSAGYMMPLQTQKGAYYTPPLIKNIDRMLSAGYVLLRNFGTTKPGSQSDGGSKVKRAQDLLAEIQLTDKMLLDSTGQVLAKTQLVSGWPDDTTATIGSDGVTPEPPAFTMSKKF